jgi:nucleoside-diphosphate-sugar epimerase
VKPGQVFSRIHVDDIATVLEASMASPRPGRIYNVCDDEPAPPQDVVAFAAGLLGVEPPPEQPYDSAELSPMARTFYKDNRGCGTSGPSGSSGWSWRTRATGKG